LRGVARALRLPKVVRSHGLVARVELPPAGLDALIGEGWLVTRGLPSLFLESVSGCEQPLHLRSRRRHSLGWPLEQSPGWVGQDDGADVDEALAEVVVLEVLVGALRGYCAWLLLALVVVVVAQRSCSVELVGHDLD
jgi:hypothetical protein